MAITDLYVNSAGSGSADGSSAANALSWASMVTAINGGGTAGNRYNVVGSISRTTTTDTISGSGTATSPVVIRGYASTIGDGYLGRTNNNGALITTNMPAISYTTGRLNITGTYILLETLSITSAASNATVTIAANDDVRSCVITNTGTNASSGGLLVNSAASATDCDCSFAGASGGAYGLTVGVSGGRAIGCRVTASGSADGIRCNASVSITDCVVYGCSGKGIITTGTAANPAIQGCTITGCTSDGVNIITASTGLPSITNCLITDNGGFGINMVSTANKAILANNRYRDNTSGNLGNAGDWTTATNYAAVTSGNGTSDYTASGSQDYSLISTSPAVNAGQPYARSIGALQRSQTASGGGLRRARQMYDVKQSSNSYPLMFNLVQTDGQTPLTGATPTVTISKAGGSLSSPSGAVSEISGGGYKVAGNSTDTNTLGPLWLHVTVTGGPAQDFFYNVVAYDPQSATNLGLSAIPTANPSVTGGLLTAANNSNYAKGVVDTVVASFNGYASLGAGAALANPRYLSYTGTLSPSTTSSVFAQDVDTIVYNSREIYYNGNSWRVWWNGSSSWVLSSVVGTNGSAYWTSPTLGGTWTPNGTATGSPVFVVLGGAENPASTTNITTVGAVSGAVGSVTGNVGGNVNGTVASVVGNVGGNVVGSVASVTAGVTVSTNSDKTGYSLTAAYDDAKTAAQPGDQMDLVNAPNSTALSAIAASVWNALTSGITTNGSIGKLIVDGWAKFTGITYLAKWLSLIMGKTADATTTTEVQLQTASAGYNNTTMSLESIHDGGGGATAGDVEDAKDEVLAAIGGLAGGNIELNSPVSTDGGTLTITQGDDLYSADFTAATWDITGTFPSISGASAVLNLSCGGVQTTVTGLSLSLNGSTLTVTAQIPSATTSQLYQGTGVFQVRVTWANTHGYTYINGTLIVVRKASA